MSQNKIRKGWTGSPVVAYLPGMQEAQGLISSKEKKGKKRKCNKFMKRLRVSMYFSKLIL